MTNKRLAYVLLPAALLVWGVILFRIWHAVKADEYFPTASSVSALPKATARKALPKLGLQYLDPFHPNKQLSTRFADQGPRDDERKGFRFSPLSPTSALTPAHKAAVAWPKIEFTGLIENQRGNKRVAVLSLDGAGCLVEEGKTQESIKVMRITPDSVQLQYRSEIKSFRREVANSRR